MKHRILIVHNYYQIPGGEDTVVSNEKRMLEENGHQVFFYTRHNDEIKKSKLELCFLPINTIWSLRTYIEVKSIIKNNKIDIVHCHNTFPLISPSVYYAAFSLHVPVIQTIHNFRLLCPNGTFFCNDKICEKCYKNGNFIEAINNNCYRSSKLQTIIVVVMLIVHRMVGTFKNISYIFLTDFNRRKFDKLIDINSRNVFIKPNFVRQFKMNNYKKDKVFVFASRLEEIKGIKFLLEYWKELPSDYILHIYGDGPLKEYVLRNLKSNIIYMGFKSQKEIFNDIGNAMALISPSICYEGFPMIIAESMSLGCPVLASNIGNAGGIVRSSGGGVLFNPYDKKTFLKSLEQIMLFNDEYRNAACAYYANILNPEKNIKILEEIYDQCSI